MVCAGIQRRILIKMESVEKKLKTENKNSNKIKYEHIEIITYL